MILRVVRAGRRAVARAKLLGHLQSEGSLVIGPGLRATRGCTLRTADRVSIGADCTLMAHVHIGPDVMVSSRVAFIGDDHPFQNLGGSITTHAPRPLSHIVLKGDNLIGYGAILIGPVTVGHGAVVAAGAVVTGDVAPDTVAAGVPARPISTRRRGPLVSEG